MKLVLDMSSVNGNGRTIPEDEVRVKKFFIREVENHPNIWKHCHPAQKRGSHPPSKLSSQNWQGIMLNMREAFKGDPALLAKYKADTVMGLKDMWRFLCDLHRRRWANEIENSGTWECPFYDSFEFLRLSMQVPWPAELKECDKCSYKTNRGDKMREHKKWNHGKNANKKKPHMCHECGWRVQTKWLLKEHINSVHLNLKLYKCDQCHYSSGSRNNMNSHNKIHQPDEIGKKHMCHQCIRSFRTPFKLREHVDAVHLKMKPFKCGVGDCEWVTGFLANVGVHRRKVHGIQMAKKGCPRTLTNAPPEEDDTQNDDSDDEEAHRTEIRRAIIEEVRKHPRVWEPIEGRSRGSKLGPKEDWHDIVTNLESAIKDNVYFQKLHPRSKETPNNDSSVFKEASMKKIKQIWYYLAHTYKRLADKKGSSDNNDDSTSDNWPFYDSMKFLSNGNHESSDKSDTGDREPQIFRDVRKYVQQQILNEAEKGSTSGTKSTDGFVSTFVWVRNVSEAKSLQSSDLNLDSQLTSDLNLHSQQSDLDLHSQHESDLDLASEEEEEDLDIKIEPKVEVGSLHGDNCALTDCDESVEQEDFDDALESVSAKLETEPAPGGTEQVRKKCNDNETQNKEELFSSFSPVDSFSGVRDNSNIMTKNKTGSLTKQCDASVDNLDPEKNVTKSETNSKMVANSDERVEQHDFDDSLESLSSKIETEPEPAVEEQLDNVSKDSETQIEKGLSESNSPIDTVQEGVEVHASIKPESNWRKGRPKKRYNTSTENLDRNVIVTKSETDRDLLIYKGNTFIVNTTKPGWGDFTHWVCRKSGHIRCGARLSAVTLSGLSGHGVLLDSLTQHNHAAPEEFKMGFWDPLMTIRFRKIIHQIITSQPDLKAIGIYLDATKKLDNDALKTLEFDLAMNLIDRMRRNFKHPKKKAESLPKKPRIQLICETCGYQTKNACILRKHMERRHAENRTFLCDKCSFSTNYPQHLEEHSKAQHLKCGQCDFVCSGSYNLKIHVSKEHMALRCGEEGCGFANKSTLIMDKHMLDTHQKVVKLARSLTCNDCGHLTETESSLAEHAKKEHERGEEDNRTKLECGRCDFVTRREHKLKMHQSLPHPIRCELCDYQGVSDRFLIVHMRVKHSQAAPKRNQCQYCPYAAQSMGILTKHIRALHLKEEVKCPLCDFTAVWRPLLKAHKIKVHCNQGEAGIQPKPKRGRPRKQHNTSSGNRNVILTKSESCSG